MEYMGVASGSGWNLWVWRLGVVVRRYIDFLMLLIPTPLVSVIFYSNILLFVHFLKCIYIIESIDSISRDERDVPLTQYITNA